MRNYEELNRIKSNYIELNQIKSNSIKLKVNSFIELNQIKSFPEFSEFENQIKSN